MCAEPSNIEKMAPAVALLYRLIFSPRDESSYVKNPRSPKHSAKGMNIPKNSFKYSFISSFIEPCTQIAHANDDGDGQPMDVPSRYSFTTSMPINILGMNIANGARRIFHPTRGHVDTHHHPFLSVTIHHQFLSPAPIYSCRHPVRSGSYCQFFLFSVSNPAHELIIKIDLEASEPTYVTPRPYYSHVDCFRHRFYTS